VLVPVVYDSNSILSAEVDIAAFCCSTQTYVEENGQRIGSVSVQLFAVTFVRNKAPRCVSRGSFDVAKKEPKRRNKNYTSASVRKAISSAPVKTDPRDCAEITEPVMPINKSELDGCFFHVSAHTRAHARTVLFRRR
jgi:hypothetical protein